MEMGRQPARGVCVYPYISQLLELYMAWFGRRVDRGRKNDPALEAYRSRVLYTNHEREPDNDPRGPIKEEVGDGGSNGGDEVFIAVDFSEVYQDRVFSERKGTEEAVRFDAEPEGIGCMACGNIRQDSVFGSAVMGHLYLHRRVGHTWATLSLPYLTSRQAPIVRGTVRWSTTISALTRRLSPAIRGQGVLGQGALVEGWSGTLALLHRSLSGETVSWPQGRLRKKKQKSEVKGGSVNIDVIGARSLTMSMLHYDDEWVPVDYTDNEEVGPFGLGADASPLFFTEYSWLTWQFWQAEFDDFDANDFS
ncbi:hypothetical protein BHM03_00014004 [Ensete ventricosum]|nr:hypothetical protein BHM03_00014004 [Ensete ventricosum]